MADEKIEEETYSLIFTSLKHPIRRKILRMLDDTPMTFSEILESLTIDSGHLNYHLESLGDLVLHPKDGKYMLSSFGTAAVRLMGGVEELPVPSSSQKHKMSQVMPKVFSLALAILLIVVSVHFVTYTTPTSTLTLNQDKIYPTPFVIDSDQTFEFNVTLEYWKYPAWSIGVSIGTSIFSRELHVGPFGPDAYTFEVELPPETFISQTRGSMWLDFSLNTTSRKPNSFVLMPFGFPNDLVVDVYTPTGDKSLGQLDWTYGNMEHFTSPTIEINQLGTYRFVITNNDSEEWTGTLRPYVEWQILEKPYFYYGIAGLAISMACLALIILPSKKTRKLRYLAQHQLSLRCFNQNFTMFSSHSVGFFTVFISFW